MDQRLGELARVLDHSPIGVVNVSSIELQTIIRLIILYVAMQKFLRQMTPVLEHKGSFEGFPQADHGHDQHYHDAYLRSDIVELVRVALMQGVLELSQHKQKPYPHQSEADHHQEIAKSQKPCFAP